MEHPVDKQAVIAFMARLLDISSQNHALMKEKADLEMEITSNNARIADCEAGLRALGHDLSQDGVWPQLYEKYLGDVQAYFNQTAHSEGVTSQAPPLPLTDTRSVPPQSSISKLLLERLHQIGSKGSKAQQLRDWLKKTHDIDSHYKTVGMSLYRLSQDSPPKVHRKGHVWFFGPPQEEQPKNPGVQPPGQLDILD